MTHRQSTNSVLMIRPVTAGSNPDTIGSNSFQSAVEPENCLKLVQEEFDGVVASLKAAGVRVRVIEDTLDPPTPDAIFPNNWFSTHGDTLVIYPMLAPSRRAELKPAPLSFLREAYANVIDLSNESRALEGTGSLVLDRTNRIAFACLSPRTSPDLLQSWCDELGFRPMPFHSTGPDGTPVYHTNVLLSIGTEWAVLAAEAIGELQERQSVLDALASRKIIEIDQDQMMRFCANILELETESGGKIIAMSETAYDGLSVAQREILGSFAGLLPLRIPTIEQVGGGSVRCMIAELF